MASEENVTTADAAKTTEPAAEAKKAEPAAAPASNAGDAKAAEKPAAENVAQPVQISAETISSLPPIDVNADAKGESIFDATKLGILNDVYVALNIEIGRSHIKIRDLLNLNRGSIIELDKLAGEPVDVYANGKLISKGNIVTVNGKYCVRLLTINEKKPGS